MNSYNRVACLNLSTIGNWVRKCYVSRFTFDSTDEYLWLHDIVRLLDYGSVILSNCEIVSCHRERFNLFLAKLWIVHAESRYHEQPILIRILNHEVIVGPEDTIENFERRCRLCHGFLINWMNLSSGTNLLNSLLHRSPPFRSTFFVKKKKFQRFLVNKNEI